MVGADPLEVLLLEAASEGSSLLTCGAVHFERTGIARGRIGSILLGPFGVAVRFQPQHGSIWAGVDVLFGIILELPLPVERSPLVKVGQGHIGTDALLLKRHDIVNRAVGRVPGRLARPQFPAEARAEDADPRIGWFSMTSEGVTNTAMMMRALPPSTT